MQRLTLFCTQHYSLRYCNIDHNIVMLQRRGCQGSPSEQQHEQAPGARPQDPPQLRAGRGPGELWLVETAVT